MKIYRVFAEHCDCEGFHYYPVCIKSFSSKKLALKFKEDWENLWQEHADKHECKSPCWYDSKKELVIKEENVETEYSGIEKNKMWF